MKVSIIVCTKGRPTELAGCIRSIIHQSRLPDEVVIVHSGTQGAVGTPSDELASPICFKHVYSPSPNYLTCDRNKGVKSSVGDVIAFVDDDVILHRDFVREIVRVFENDNDKAIGGVMGNIENIPVSHTLGAILRRLIRPVFLLPRDGNGSFLSSGSPTFLHHAIRPRDVECLSGCCMAYRREVFQEFKFDEGFLEAHFYTDDEDFSYRVSRKYRNVLTPYAKLNHYPSPIGRDKKYMRARMTLVARHYMLKKNFPRTARHEVAFWWSVIGFVTEAAVFRDKETLKGLLDGVRTLVD